MKITLKLNIGNYQNLDIQSSEYDNKEDCYQEIYDVLQDWVGITDNATKLRNHIEGILRR